MGELSTRRRFTFSLAAACAVPFASRLPLSPANAVEAAACDAPIAPVVPKAVKAFGGVRIDNYDWLRDRKDSRVVSYLDAENAYADARLEPIRPLVDELAAELKAREAQEDSTVPTAYNGYIYERRFSQGAQYPYVVRRCLDRVGGAQSQAACNRNCARSRETEGKAPSSGKLTHENNLPSAPSVYANIGPMRRLAGALWGKTTLQTCSFWRESVHLGATGAGAGGKTREASIPIFILWASFTR